jgi:hypothetical protein
MPASAGFPAPQHLLRVPDGDAARTRLPRRAGEAQRPRWGEARGAVPGAALASG